MADTERSVVLEKMYRFQLWLMPTLEKFPRHQRFLLGDRIQTLAHDVLDGLIEATYRRDPLDILNHTNLRLEKLRFALRLARDLNHLDLRRYEFAASSLLEIGRLIGGWRKACHGKA
jgi:hypothetical protein